MKTIDFIAAWVSAGLGGAMILFLAADAIAHGGVYLPVRTAPVALETGPVAFMLVWFGCSIWTGARTLTRPEFGR